MPQSALLTYTRKNTQTHTFTYLAALRNRAAAYKCHNQHCCDILTKHIHARMHQSQTRQHTSTYQSHTRQHTSHIPVTYQSHTRQHTSTYQAAQRDRAAAALDSASRVCLSRLQEHHLQPPPPRQNACTACSIVLLIIV